VKCMRLQCIIYLKFQRDADIMRLIYQSHNDIDI